MSRKEPKPTALKAPKPSAEELQLLKTITQAAVDQGGFSRQLFSEAAGDRSKAYQVLDRLDDYTLSPEADRLATNFGDAFYRQAFDQYTTGANQIGFQRNLRDSLASLSDMGVLNSSFGSQVLGDLYKERMRGIGDIANSAASQAAQSRANLFSQQQQTDFNIFSTLLGQNAYSNQVAGQLNSAAMNSLGNVANQYRQYRADEFNVNAQNEQAMYAWRLSNFRNRRGLAGGLGNILGTAAGAAVGMIPGFGAAIGGPMGGAALGGSLGSTVGGLF